jgi:hypothetical protein
MCNMSLRQNLAHLSKRHQGRGKRVKTSANHGLTRKRRYRPALDVLEDRSLPSVTLLGAPDWVEQGPGPIGNGFGVQKLEAGATNGIAADPFDANLLFVGTVNGGVWRTTNATALNPHWTTATDQLPSLSIGAVAISPLDNTGAARTAATPLAQTVVFAGHLDNSSGRNDGAPLLGVIKSTNGGDTWTETGQLAGVNISKIIPTTLTSPAGQAILAATSGGLFRSPDGGSTWTKISGSDGSSDGIDNNGDGIIDEPGELNLPNGGINDLQADPGNANRYYVAIAGQGVFRSDNGGQNWQAVNTNINTLSPGLIAGSAFLQLATHDDGANNVVYAAVVPTGATAANPPQIFRSTNQGGAWTAMDNFPELFFGQNSVGVMAADPTDPNIVFLAGLQGAFPGDIFRGDFGTAPGSQWQGMTGAATNGTETHPDIRGLAFNHAGDLLCSNDGGIYRLANPNTAGPTRQWFAVDGDLRSAELYTVAYDSVNHRLFGGAQDNGSPAQNNIGGLTWNDQTGSDGTVSIVDNNQTAHPNQSIHYNATQGFGGFVRTTYDNTNTPVTTVNPGLVVASTGGQNIYQVEANNPGGSTIRFVQPYAINSVDSNRLLVGTNFLYESTDQGANLTSLGGVMMVSPGQFKPIGAVGSVDPVPTFRSHGNPIVYGGRRFGVDNAAVIWIGAGGQLLFRETGAGLPTVVNSYTAAGGGVVQDIAVNREDYGRVYVVDTSSRVWASTDKGATWVNITAKLSSLSNDLRTIEVFSPTAATDVVLVGGLGGVFRTLDPQDGANALWTEFGAGMPNAIDKDLHYDPTDDVLVAGTWGRGAFTIGSASASLATPGGVLQIDGDTDFPGEDDVIRLVRNAANPSLLDVYLNSAVPTKTVQMSVLQQINVNGLGGNDTLIVDSSNGLINVPLGIRYDGGTGFDKLDVVQTGGTTQTSDVYSVGPNAGEGSDVITGPGTTGVQTISFQNLAPVLDTVPATTATANGTPANNAINYTQGSVPANGLVTIDNQESYEFSNKDSLVINGLAGNDVINLNNSSPPAGATGVSLASITVNGGDPTDTDTLIVNGTGTVNVATDTSTIAGAGPVSITYATIEALIANAANNNLTITGSNTYTYTPGAAADAGTVQCGMLPISFTGVGSGKTLTLTGSGGGATVTANGTNGNDSFTLAATTGAITLGGALAGRATIAPTAISNLIVNGLDGDDAFSATGAQPYTNITLAGGDPSASDVANLTGNGTAVVAHLGGASASVTGGGLGNVSLPGIEVLNLNAGAGSIILAGTSGGDAFTVTPTGANTATSQVGSLSPVVNSTTTSTLTVDPDGGSDTLAVNATSAGDTINVSGAAVTVVGLQTVNFLNVESLGVNGLAGSDTFNVTSSATVPISIDGGDPVGVLPGDVLNIVTVPGDMVNIFPGPTSDSGGVVVNSNQPISYVHIESLSVSGGGTPVISGTNGNDVITIIARDSSYAPGLDGIQDFTVSVNAGPNILFIDTPSLTVHALAGNDQIVVQAPAPNLAAWNVALTLDGGPSSALGDQLVVSTPGANQATYTPASANSGTLGVTNSNGNVSNVTITDIENFVYDGQAGGDGLTMVGSSAANVFTLNPGATNDAGTLSMDSTLPVTFQNLGSGGQVAVNGNGGADVLNYNGTPGNDTFVINTSALGGQVNLNARVPLLTANISNVFLNGLGGDDTFTLVPTILSSPYLLLHLVGGTPASATGSQANLTATAGTPIALSGQVLTQGAVTVAGSALQNENLSGAGNDVTYNSVVGVTENINVIASPTARQGQVSVPGVALWSFNSVPVVYVNGTLADNDTVTFTGTNNSEVYQINLAAAGTDADPVLKLQTTTGSTLLTLGNYKGFQTLNIAGLDGQDVFNVTVAPTGPGRQIFINGDLPSGKKKQTDVLNVIYVRPKPRIVSSVSTQDHDAGLVSADYGTGFPSFLIQYDGIENVTIRQQ